MYTGLGIGSMLRGDVVGFTLASNEVTVSTPANVRTLVDGLAVCLLERHVCGGAHRLTDPGQPIAKVGTTGGSLGCHLHFIIRINGQLTDPVPFMSARGIRLG